MHRLFKSKKSKSACRTVRKTRCRKTAKELGNKYYFGNLCPYSHGNLRYTSSGHCVECVKIKGQKFARTVSGKLSSRTRGIKYYKAHRSEVIKRKVESNRLAGRNAKRRAAKLRATPSWADLNAIRAIYAQCPKGYHVDHIVPLKGKNVCGLHIAANLQILSAQDNISKNNKF